MEFAIRHRFTDNVLFSCDAENMREAVEKAVSARAYLDGANLDGANLARAYLAGAYLAGANLAGAYLAGAYLAGANLDGAYLDGANLAGANLARAYLDGANLDGANLDGANLDGANLDGAYLDGETLSIAPVQVSGLYWPVLITPGFMRIGCQRHTHAEWEAFGPDEIAGMSDYATEFWMFWRTPLLMICMQHREQAAK